MTSAPFADMPSSRDPLADHDSENGSDRELSVKDDSPPSKTSKKRTHDDSDKDEPETKSAREDLRQTRISDREKSKSPKLEGKSTAVDGRSTAADDKEMEEPLAVKTPEPQSPADRDEEMKDRSSPKKKRPRDREDDDAEGGVPTATTNGDNSTNRSAVNGGSILPLKKRHRDASQDGSISEDGKSIDTKEPQAASSSTVNPTSAPNHISSELSGNNNTTTKDAIQTSADAFKSSGFAALASAPSPFATTAASKPSVFGGSVAQKPAGFGTLASTNGSPPLSGFGSLTSNPVAGFGGVTTGGFGGLSGGFGGGFGGGFSGTFGTGPRLTSFAAPAAKTDLPETTTKPTTKKEKAFGAPESSEDEGSEDEGSDDEAGGDDEEDQPAAEEKKKVKAPRAPMLDGEEDEITLCQVRSKLFVSDQGWKERGVGALKINIPQSNGAKMLFDENDEEALITLEKTENEDGEANNKDGNTQTPAKPSYTARLIMRQDSTHRVILNSVVLKETKFTEKPTNTAIGILFTAFEDGKPINMQLKMNAANAKEFLREIEEVQSKL